MPSGEYFDDETPSVLYREGRLTFGDIWTSDHAMEACLDEARLAAPVDISVLIIGETGTGKNLLAQAIHNASKRSRGPFVAVNIASLSDSLLTAELFGSVQGAFTGAVDRPGYMEKAHGGTLFVDEIGGLKAEHQQAILTALEEKRVTRVGDTAPGECDFRVISATSRDLAAAKERGDFRSDLYYRIRHMEIPLPPLRERADDIEMLATRFLGWANEALGRKVQHISEGCLERMREHTWPGNVRELRAAMLTAVLHCTGDTLEAVHMCPELVGNGPPERGGAQGPGLGTLEAVQRRHIAKVLLHTGWHKARAAKILGITRPTLNKKIKDYGLGPPG